MKEHPDKLVLMAYRDGELEGAVRDEVAAHVSMCAACRGEAEGLKELSGLFSEARELKAPAGLAERIKVKAREKRSVWGEVETLKIARWLTVAAAGVMAVASAGLWMRSMDDAQVAGNVAGSGRMRFDSASTLMVADASVLGMPGSDERQFAQWMVADLSGRLATNSKGNGHE